MEHRAVTVGVLSPVTGGFFFGKILLGITRAVYAAGGRVLALQTLDANRYDNHEGSLRPLPYDLRVGWSRIDGFVSIVTAVGQPYLEAARAAGKPVVLVSQQHDGFTCPCVVPGNHGGTFAAVTHLIEHGHRDIAFVGNLEQTDLQERYAGYVDALTEHGIAPDPALFFHAPDNMTPGGTRAAAALLASDRRVTAVVTGTDANAVGLLRALRTAGRAVPDDIAVVGFDDTDEADQADPPLTTISANFDGLGELAGDLILRLLRGDPVAPEKHYGVSSLVTRRSCGCGLTGSAGQEPVVAPESVTTGQLSPATRAVHTLAGPQDRRAQVVDAFREYLADPACTRSPASEDRRSGSPSTVTGGALLQFVLSVMQAESSVHAAFRVQTHRYLYTQYNVTAELATDRDPSDLSWWAATEMPLACLGKWAGASPQDDSRTPEGILELTGVHGAELSPLRGTRLPAAEFPPRALLDHVDGEDQVAFVLAVRTEHGPWGVLAVRGPIDVWSVDGREMFNHWTAQLGTALSQFHQRNELTTAYHRVQDLVDELRVSEERYALAALSATDVLWDWDLGTGTVFYSERWTELLGEAREVDPTPQEWLARVHADDLEELTAAVNRCRRGRSSTLESEHRLCGANGSYRWVLCRGLAVPGTDGRVARLVGSFADVHERKQAEERLRQGALCDQLTGLGNRAMFLEQLQAAIDRGIATSRRFSVLFCDLDGFKPVNDTHGHAVGDLLLAAVARRLTETVRADDVVARLGGDEFGILLPSAGRAETVEVMERVQASVGSPYFLEGKDLRIGVSIGMAMSDAGYTDATDALRAADAEMYRVKFTGRRPLR